MTADEREDRDYARRAANGAKGGYRRAARLSKARRVEIAKYAIACRWIGHCEALKLALERGRT